MLCMFKNAPSAIAIALISNTHFGYEQKHWQVFSNLAKNTWNVHFTTHFFPIPEVLRFQHLLFLLGVNIIALFFHSINIYIYEFK